MEKNIINESILLPEDAYETHISKTLDNLKKYKDIKITGKILHYLEEPVLYYYCTSISNTKSNPFDLDIEFGFEFINKEIPYVTILTEFIEPTMNDNRNYYRCLTHENKYRFSLNKLEEQEKILGLMIEGIENFLTYLNESIAVNTFIFFGEYELGHIYQINDFFQNKNYLNFYRINEIKNKKQEEKYIIFTKLYFLLFEPTPHDKALVKLVHSIKLRDLNLFFDKNEQNNSLILKLSKTKQIQDIEFTLIDRSRKKENEEVNLVEEEEINEIKERDDKPSYSILMKEWFNYKDKVNFDNYDIVLNKYKILFSDSKGYLIITDKKKNRIEEFNNHIKFNEKLVELYNKLKNKNNEGRVHKLISNIIYICSELVNYADTTEGKENEYLMKIRKFINANKK